MWDADEDGAAEPFFQAVAREAGSYDASAYVTLGESPRAVRAEFPLLT